MQRPRPTRRTGEAVTALLVERIAARLVGAAAPDGSATVAAVLPSGAVDADPSRLSVVVLLDGAERLPSRWQVGGADLADAGFDRWLRTVDAEVRQLLAGAGWPAAADVPVVFDRAQRVDDAGGAWRYFR